MARRVYDRVPYLSDVFEQKFNQKLLALAADNGYNLGTSFEWNELSDLKGRKLAGAGLNLKWLEFAGAVPVQSSLPEAYTSMSTGVYNGWIMFPDGYLNFKLYEPGKYYTLIGFGAMTWNGLTINKRRFDSLPDDVKSIILEVAREYELKTGQTNSVNYTRQLEQLKKEGTVIKELPEDVRIKWANSLKDWPQELANELNKRGLPATQVLNAAIEEAEKLGYKWPLRYIVK